MQVLSATASGQTTTYLPGLGEQNASGLRYYLSDSLGSVRQLTDASGAVLMAQSFEPYGKVLSSVGSASAFGCAGEIADASGLQYLRPR